jgi:hypothetical protein
VQNILKILLPAAALYRLRDPLCRPESRGRVVLPASPLLRQQRDRQLQPDGGDDGVRREQGRDSPIFKNYS